jgi:hypothetical protein
LEHDGHTLVVEGSKVVALFSFFDDILRVAPQRQHTTDLDLLDLPQLQLSKLGDQFTEQEILQVIQALLPDKASGPNGFMARFLLCVWEIIELEVMNVFNAFWYMDAWNFQEINGDLLVLLPQDLQRYSDQGLPVDFLDPCHREALLQGPS